MFDAKKKFVSALLSLVAATVFVPSAGYSTESGASGPPGVPSRAIVMLVAASDFPDEFRNFGMNEAAAAVADGAGCEVLRFYPALSAMTGHATMVFSARSPDMSETELVEVLRKHPLVFSAEKDTFVSVPAPPIRDDASFTEPGERG